MAKTAAAEIAEHRRVPPFIIADIVLLVLLMLFPIISLLLPQALAR